MSWLGIVANVAKVGVGLLNGVLNGGRASPANVDHATAIAKNPACAFYVQETGETWRMLSAYVVHSSCDPTRIGKTLSFDAGDALQQGDVAFTLVKDPVGGQTVTAVNNSTTTDYYVNFGTTAADASVSNSQILLGRQGGQYPTAATIQTFMQDYSLGNAIVTPVQVGQASASASNLGPLIPLSTVLGNVGLGSIIAGSMFYIYRNTSQAYVSCQWQKSSDGSSISGMLVTNTSGLNVNVSANVQWNNPAIQSTVNTNINGGTASAPKTSTVVLPDNKSPISGASVSAFVNGQNSATMVQILNAQVTAMKAAGIQTYTVSLTSSASNEDDALISELTQIEKELLTVAANILSTHGADDSIVSKDVLRAYNKIGANVPALNRFLAKQNSTKKLNSGMSRLSFE